jgi:hypothetical protein
MPTKKPAANKPAVKKAAVKKAVGRRGPGKMTDTHKAALAAGRQSGRAVRSYLNALESHKPKRGRKRTPDSVTKRLELIHRELPAAEPIRRLSLLQEQLDLQAELQTLQETEDISALEADFIANAKHYSDNKNITYNAWRAIGISPTVLHAAGITRTRTHTP